MPRPASITATGSASTLWSTGSYAYYGAGNVTRMGHAGYDLVALVHATTNPSVQGYPGDLPTPGATGTNAVSATPPAKAVIAGAAVLPLVTNGSGTVLRDPGSVTKGYPSEGYAYKMVEGQLMIEALFTVPEQDPSKLNGPMNVPIPFWPPL